MPWYDWYQTDLPCQYSPHEAIEAEAYLNDALGKAFTNHSGALRATHPILKEWDTTGANAFLQLNALADDIRLVRQTPGMDVILADLRDERLCLPTWHLLHTAAMFERANAGAALEFVEAGDGERPDALVDVAGHAVPLEAKLLMASGEEARFEKVARQIESAIDAEGGTPPGTFVRIVLKKETADDDVVSVIGTVKDAISAFTNTPIVKRSSQCNVFIDPVPSPSGIADFRILYVLAPVPDSENVRALSRAKKASKQLRSLPSGQESGILSIGLTDNQDGAAVFDHLGKRVRMGRLRGISAIMLVKRRTHLALPRRMNVDLLEVRPNSAAQRPLAAPLRLRPGGGAAMLTRVEPPTVGIRAYRLGASHGRITDPKTASLSLPDLRTVTAEDLR